MSAASYDTMRIAQDIVDSDRVLAVYAACGWDELSDDGKAWIAEIVTEARRRFSGQPAPRRETGSNVKAAPFTLTPRIVGNAIDAMPTRKPLSCQPVSPRPITDERKATVIGRIEPARVAPAQAEPSAPTELPNLGRPGIGDTRKRAQKPLPPLMADVRRARLVNAIAYLKARCILVDVANRDAEIRLYRVSGKQSVMLADEVIAFAEGKGFEVKP